MTWPALLARVAGLRSRLVRRDDLDLLARAPDLPALARAFTERGVLPETPADAAQLEAALRRRTARWLTLLARWHGGLPRRWRDVLDPVFADEERRGIRALVRGAAAGLPAEDRLAGVLPTPALPERALRELAGQPTVSAVVALLVAWGHPFGAALREESLRPQPDLLRLDVALTQAWAAQGRDRLKRALPGVPMREELAQWLRDRLDVENALTALVLAGERATREPVDYFAEGGEHLPREAFLAAAGAAAPGDAAVMLATGALAGTETGKVLERNATRLARLEDELLAASLRTWRQRARTQSLGLAPVLAAFLALRAEARDCRRLTWSISLGAPPALPDDLVSAA